MIRTTIVLVTIVGVYTVTLWSMLKCIDIAFDYYEKRKAV